MTVGAVPLFPLYRVQPTPEARLQRFGVNDSQLFGKAMLRVTVPESQPAQAPQVGTRARANAIPTQDALDGRRQARLDPPTHRLESSPTYVAQPGVKSVVNSTPKPGTQLDVKA